MSLPLSILSIHWIGDFILQNDWMAINKSKRWDALCLHVLVYSLCFVAWGPWFVAVTFVIHFVTDAITSRITNRLWFIELEPMVVPLEDGTNMYARISKSKRHWFFVMIGLDQLLHYVQLAITIRLLSA